MFAFHDPIFVDYDSRRDAERPSLRSFREIAAILAERDHVILSEEDVQRVCESAEDKFVRAVSGDAAIRRQIKTLATRSRRSH